MFPVLFLVGAAVSVTASCAAFLFDSATESERERHDELMDEARRTRECMTAVRTQHADDWQAELRQQASRHRRGLRKELARLNTEHQQIAEEVQQLEEQLARDLAQIEHNPFRRRTLLQGSARIEDARARLDAHRAYRQNLANDLKQRWSKDDYEGVLQLDPPTFKLPAEWLYVGKALLIEAPGDLNRPLRFGQRLHLTSELLPQGFSDARQRLHLANYPDNRAIPIQVIKQDARNPQKFFGCVARGIAYSDHILTREPLDFRVERSIGSGYLGSLFDGSIQVYLPINRLPDPSQGLRPGQTIAVWPEVYDLLLTKAPGTHHRQGKSKRMQVSARAPAELDPHGQRLTLVVSETTEGAELLDANLALDGWRLSHFEERDDRLDLINGRTCVQCELDRQHNLLIAIRCECVADNLDGLTLPIPIEPVDARLADDPYMQSPEGMDCLLQLAIQSQDNPEREQQRAAQVRFLNRWREVIDYQQEDCKTSIEFSAMACADEEMPGRWRLAIGAEDDLSDDLANWSENYRQLAKDERRVDVRLEMWRITGSGHDLREDWHPVVWGNRPEIVSATARTIDIRFTPRRGPVQNACENQPQRYRLTVIKPDQPLRRQRAALDAFGNDRLVEPALKERLLTPASIAPGVDRDWSMRVAAGLPWRNPALTPTQKQVIETCLTTSHLALVQGPPGTAKTTCIVEMLHQIYTAKPNTRVLLVSQQNAAVDNALVRFLESRDMAEQPIRILRIGREDKIQPELLDHGLSACIEREYDRWLETAQRQRHHRNQAIAETARQWQTLAQGLRDRAAANARGKPDPEVAELLLNGHNLVGATCVGLATPWLGLDRLTFDIAIIDEAGRATVPELLIPLLRARKAILIGDHHQLPPTVAPLLREEKTQKELPFLDDAFLKTSFFETLFRTLPGECRAQLREQYRMAPAIGDLVADLFYTEDGQRGLINGQRQPDRRSSFPLLTEPLGWIDVHGRQETGTGKSLRNPAEARAIARFLSDLAAPAAASGGKEVAVITPYRAQVHCIVKELRKLANGEGDHQRIDLGGLQIKVDTVDSFQGSEAHLVCYSTVRTHGSLQFLLDEKRLNVACSRARENLIFFGHAHYLSQHRPVGQRNLFNEILARTVRLAPGAWQNLAGPIPGGVLDADHSPLSASTHQISSGNDNIEECVTMPCHPLPVTYRCGVCGWSKTSAPSGNALPSNDHAVACPRCGHTPLHTRPATTSKRLLEQYATKIARVWRTINASR